ncbi:hypothetical protein Lnau_1992 [Legionella nautarum]|uniref:Uncharacterized protein n=1 Tax=Legionella nautarum TaxID=45070 RepID=A0A0W0WRY8_9GAMM|nr:hypothetical protein [Legionella nautarum]KTD35102.1 hypothetical protein Lnau_1992 [Legionella nautarum]
MSIFKSTFDAIGTGSGVAWPSFGILSSALSLGIGGAAMAALGSVCCGLFLLVSVPVFYLTYKKSRLEESRLNEKLAIHLSRFIDQLHDCYLNQAEQLDFYSYLNQLDRQSERQLNLQVQFLEFIKKNTPQFFRKYEQFSPGKREAKLKEIISAFLNSSDFEETIKPLSNDELLDGAFLSFVGVFGAAAGCSSGVIGVLAGVGLFGGFGVIPVLATIVLTTAILLAVCGALVSIHSHIEKNKKTQIYKNFKTFNADFAAEMTLGDTQESKQNQKASTHEVSTGPRDWRLTGVKTPGVAKVRETLFHLHDSRHPDHLPSMVGFSL